MFWIMNDSFFTCFYVGIVWANGHQWLELNKLILQGQHKTTVIENMQQQLSLEVNTLCQCFSPNDAMDPLDHFFNSTLNIISIMAFGKRLNYCRVSYNRHPDN